MQQFDKENAKAGIHFSRHERNEHQSLHARVRSQEVDKHYDIPQV